ncbi:MAG: hemerythrin domain-containing protein [Pyrinomonadaceae bacterium]
MPSFNDLLELHSRLDDLFLEHQRALLRLELDRAAAALDEYATELLAHIRDEEESMIPLYRDRVNAPVGGAAELFLGEHEKLKRFLVLFAEEIEKIRNMDDVERGVLFLIDSQHLFKRLLAHHDTRERKMLYPLLDEVTTLEEREKLFAQFELTPRVSVATAS